MVCLTSCVFRSIRFSGFARPHRLGCGARENYTRTCGRGQGREGRSTGWTQIGEEWLFRALSRPRKAGPGPQAPRPAPAGRASAPLDARRRAGRAAAARGTAARGRRRCGGPRPSRAHALLRRPPPRKRGQRARPADDRAFPARAAAPSGAQIGPSSPCAGRDAA